jgi:hypothetical protein
MQRLFWSLLFKFLFWFEEYKIDWVITTHFLMCAWWERSCDKSLSLPIYILRGRRHPRTPPINLSSLLVASVSRSSDHNWH